MVGLARRSGGSPTAQGESLGRGMSAHKRLQTGVFLKRQGYRARNRHGHGQYPYRAEGAAQQEANLSMILPDCRAQNILAQDLRNGHLVQKQRTFLVISSCPLSQRERELKAPSYTQTGLLNMH